MIIKQRSLIHILKSIKVLNRILVAFLFVVIVFFFFSFSKKSTSLSLNTSALNKIKTLPPSCFDHNLVGKGALALSSEIQSFPFPDLSGEVLFLAKNTRPDASPYEIKLEIGLKGSRKSLIVNPEQMLYLAYDQEHLSFSKEVTPLWIKPKLDENGGGYLQMGIQITNEEGEKLLDEVREFKVGPIGQTKGIGEVLDRELKLGGEILQGGKWWGPDKLYEGYGGEEFEKYKEHERIEIQTEKGKKILFINEGDTFIWKDDEWLSSLETKGFSMGKVRSVSPYKIEWQIWDKGGMESVLVAFNKEKPSVISIRIEDVFARLRRRTSSRVSCRIGNRATILKEGDWLVHLATGWRTIKNYSEVEALLRFDIMGDLFIFDGLEKADGKEVFCGTLFNPMRTEKHYVKLPITQIKSRKHSSPKKNTFSTRIGPLTTEEPLRDHSNQKPKPIEESDSFGEN